MITLAVDIRVYNDLHRYLYSYDHFENGAWHAKLLDREKTVLEHYACPNPGGCLEKLAQRLVTMGTVMKVCGTDHCDTYASLLKMHLEKIQPRYEDLEIGCAIED